MMAGMQILVVDDDDDVRESLRRSLEFEGYDVRTAADGEQALAEIAERAPDAVVLDLQMPRLDGLATCRRLRATGHDLPILMLTARDATRDRVTGLDAGADDYLPKPFALEELLARLRAVLRRRPPTETVEELLCYDDMTMDLGTREVTRGGLAIELTRTEYSLLELFLANPRVVLTRARILREVWGYDFDPGSNTLEVYVGYLRRKTEQNGASRLIHNVRGVGYALRTPAGASAPRSAAAPGRR
jgi:two-component system, OmpR family, response regulator MprA